ncbi:MAG: hypothetical protein SGJ27_21285 [Candidatus Melainabacteria bacterium]|nr:hypothetical protein [Candidatus Melainabacteria bacterium]
MRKTFLRALEKLDVDQNKQRSASFAKLIIAACFLGFVAVPAFQYAFSPENILFLVILGVESALALLAILVVNPCFQYDLRKSSVTERSKHVSKLVRKQKRHAWIFEMAIGLVGGALLIIFSRQAVADWLFAANDFQNARRFYQAFPLSYPKTYRYFADKGPMIVQGTSANTLQKYIQWCVIAREVYGSDSLELANAFHQYGDALAVANKFAAAQVCLETSVGILSRITTPEGYGDVLLSLGYVYERIHSSLSEQTYRDSLSMRLQRLDPDSWRIQQSRWYLANYLHRNNRLPDEAAQLDRARKESNAKGNDTLKDLQCLMSIFVFYAFIIDAVYTTSGAAPICPRASKLKQLRKSLQEGLNTPTGVDMNKLEDLCAVLIYQGNYAEADELTAKVIRLAESSPELVLGRSPLTCASVIEQTKGI